MVPIGNTTARWMTLRYGLALGVIALCTLAGFVMTERVIDQHADMLEVVNISGRQRMLSQRTALLVEQLRNAPTDAERSALTARLAEATDMFERAHRRLTGADEGPAMGKDVRRLYFDGPEPLNDLVLRHIAALRAVIAAGPAGLPPDMPEADLVTHQALGPLLAGLEDMVARYQEAGERGFATLHNLGFAALILTLLTLCAEVLVIFRPMVRQVQHQFADITRMTQALEQTNVTLEAQVRARTAELHTAKVAAEQAHLAKSRFLAHAGHDLKQPLQAINMFTGMLERQLDKPRSLALVKDLRLAQRSMHDLLNAILDISKLESGVVEPKTANVALFALFDQLEAEFTGIAENKGLRLRVVPTDLSVRTDPFLLERILRNLLTNAVRYTEQGGVLMGCRRRGDSVWIEVYDTGRGIAEADRRRIFEEFVQLDRPDRDRSEGIGLGLAIVDRLARLLGHPLELRSVEGRGTVFAVGVPLVSSLQETVAA
ncbi:histidine kinase [Azospirillum baldaniorum]|uniref:histidine kinase n=1 Tax=Azospirillum baldaniorum TaxID=1064539 RepID=A0A9P1NME3_9PROT|nr:ATP-binding protein [Azospirillum baldaniorum]AWJ89878.1 histidine kinase [Azospirillum baldaniorum]TWA75439.1 signal transduction histidine kinase [Azospirillum brasilense]CCC98111.1 signal transduction histidine kinase [Azospirillum baldaniorum]